MKLYYSPLSTYSQKALIAFYEKGITFQPELVSLMTPEGRAAYEAVNPMGKLPYMVPKEGWQVPESTSIIEYLEDEFPGTARLIPAEGGAAARQVRFMDRMADLYLNDQVTELLFQKFGFRPVNEERAARARKFVDLTYKHWGARLAKQTWMCGESFTMADCASIPPLFYAQYAAPFDAYPAIVAYWQRARERPSYAKVLAEFEPIWKGMLAAGKGGA